MERTIKTTFCDVCGEEIKLPPISDDEFVSVTDQEKFFKQHRMSMPVRRYFDDTDGRTFYSKPLYTYREIDICDDCLKKAVRLRDVGVQCVKVEFDEGKWYE